MKEHSTGELAGLSLATTVMERLSSPPTQGGIGGVLTASSVAEERREE